MDLQTLPLFVKAHFGWNSTASGLVIFALISPSLLGTVVGNATERRGPRWLSVGCFLFSAVALFVLGFAVTISKSTPIKVLFVILVILVGVGISVQAPAHMVAISVAADRLEDARRAAGAPVEAKSQGYALVSIAAAAGMLLGPLWVVLIKGKLGWLGLCISYAILAVVSAIIQALSWKTWK